MSMDRPWGVQDVRYPSRDECESLFHRIVSLATGGGDTSVGIAGSWRGNLRWARNRLTTTGDTRDVTVHISRTIRGASSTISTNKLDDAALRVALESVERMTVFYGENPDADPLPGLQQYIPSKVWSDATYNLDAEQRSNIARELVSVPKSSGLNAAGYLEVNAIARAVFNTRGMAAYQTMTRASYSVTVRNTRETGSGWAGKSLHDWTKIDAVALTARAMEKCVASADPKAIEPGRYTAILEPQAVADLVTSLIMPMDRGAAETLTTPYTLRPGQSKIGIKIFDQRISISTDPTDPVGGYISFDWDGYPYRPVTWVDHGVLKELSYSRLYALDQLGTGTPLPNPIAFRMSGGTASVEEMIASTKRGLLVTRLSNVSVIDSVSLLSTGVTRDGLWLIEDGKITYPVKNFRFTESPMFLLNKIEQLGSPQQVYSLYYPTEVPALKVSDFNFTSLADAV